MKFLVNGKSVDEINAEIMETLPDNLVLILGSGSFVVADYKTGKIRHLSKESLIKIKNSDTEYREKMAPFTMEIIDLILNQLKEQGQ